mmetsp:Transcript_22868/g.49471  ORF Transcript_22868/g.49471 Transcript_22868/m.49471 type:complete len:123 (-) Transcript_22868:2337-2705(-)
MAYPFTDDGNIQLDHALNITVSSMSSSIDRALGKALKSFERACSDISHSITIVGYAAAAYLVMTGVSRLMEARNKGRLPPPNHDEHQKRNKKKNKKKHDKDMDNDGKEDCDETDPSLLDNIP